MVGEARADGGESPVNDAETNQCPVHSGKSKSPAGLPGAVRPKVGPAQVMEGGTSHAKSLAGTWHKVIQRVFRCRCSVFKTRGSHEIYLSPTVHN